MTAPRTFLDELSEREKKHQGNLAASLGLSPVTPNSPAPASPPQDVDIPSATAALARRLQLGGKIAPGTPKIGGEIETDSGTYGGEFSPEELKSYMDAAHALVNAKDEAAMRPALQQLRALSTAKPDMTAVRKP